MHLTTQLLPLIAAIALLGLATAQFGDECPLPSAGCNVVPLKRKPSGSLCGRRGTIPVTAGSTCHAYGLTECAASCVYSSGGNCESFSYQAEIQQCTLYGASVADLGFKRSAKGAQFFDRACYKTACPKPVVNGGFENSTAGLPDGWTLQSVDGSGAFCTTNGTAKYKPLAGNQSLVCTSPVAGGILIKQLFDYIPMDATYTLTFRLGYEARRKRATNPPTYVVAYFDRPVQMTDGGDVCGPGGCIADTKRHYRNVTIENLSSYAVNNEVDLLFAFQFGNSSASGRNEWDVVLDKVHLKPNQGPF